ncbi:cell division protein FtsQ [Pilibacter termitis]|uniref:Cell division protein DivIB n=1 Tax=Pilibacter termitis TaxID=263852 RepID=A0A1T4M5D5_9ENTE|nr:FtsQ-type POTRA domain-containing protein [Pilibacter termitis]SJZ61998.1 cell division protein FtsQ [Pilibacter termitis]
MNKDTEEKLTPWEKNNRAYLAQQEAETQASEEVQTSVDADGDPVFQNHRPRQEDEEEYLETELEEAEEEFPEVEYKSFSTELPKLKKQRNKLLMRRLAVISGIALTAILILVYWVSPLSKLEAIKIVGGEHLKKETILKTSGLKLGDTLWEQYFSRKTNEKNIITKNERVKSVDITLNGINTFQIQIKEFPIVAYELEETKYLPILESGVCLTNEEEKNPNKSFPILEKFTKHEKQMMNLIQEYEKLEEGMKSAITRFTLTPSKSNPDLVTIAMNDGNFVKISIEDIPSKLPLYPQVSKEMKEKGIVDMEVGVYSYPFSLEKEEQEKKEKEKTSETSTTTTSSSE